MLSEFIAKQYAHVMVKMVKACKEYGLTKNDMLVELDLCINQNGIVPAMQDKPEFKIAPVKDYVEGSRPAEPDWFGKGCGEIYEHSVAFYLRNVKDQHSKLLPIEFLFLIKYPAGCSTYKLKTIQPETKQHMFSEEAVLAFKTYIDHGDDGPLLRILGFKFMMIAKYTIHTHYRYEMSIQQAMDVLQSLG